ncbi:hypothetical protein BCR44DRAFT_43048, partial [Catenaria anguillulae PL171]
MLAILAQSFSNTQATQELLLRKLEEQTQQNALLQTKLAEVERQQREMAAVAAAVANGSGGAQQQQQHAHSIVHSTVNSAIHSAVASPMSMGTNPPLPTGFGSHRSQHLVASRNVSLDVNAPFVAPINAPPNAFTPSEAFSRLSMQAHEPFSPLTSPVFQTYIVPSPTVAQAATGNALPPLPPAAQLDHGSASMQHQHQSQDVDMDWLNHHDTASMHPSTQQQQSFPAPTEQPFQYTQTQDAQHQQHQPQQQQQQSYLPVTPAALMSSGAGSTDANNPPHPAMPSTLMQQWNNNSSFSHHPNHQSNSSDSPSPRIPPAALPPPASSSLAKESSSSARSSSSPGPLIGSKPVSAEHTSTGSSSSTRRAATKQASKLAAAPYVRQSPRMAPMSPAMVANLGSPALGPRRNSPPNMVAAAAAAAATASPAMVPVGAVPLTPANALGPNSSSTQPTTSYQQPPTPAMPPTPTSQTLHPISSGQMHPSQSATYRQMPPNLSLVSPAIHPTSATSTSGAMPDSTMGGGGSGAPPAFPTPLPPPAIDIPHTYHPYHQQHPPHLINLSGLGGYSTLGLGGGMLLHDYLGFPGPGGAGNEPGNHAGGTGGASASASAGARTTNGASFDDDMDDDDDPEARKNSHRYAEQKRRNAMKDGFDELRRLVPGLQNSVTTRRSKYNPIEPQPPVSRKKRRDAKNEGKGISKIMVLKAAYDYCAFLAGRERRLREVVVQLAQRQQMEGHAAAQPQVPVPADLLESADDIFFTYVKETLWKSAAAQQQAADEILMVAGDEPVAASAAASSMGDVSAPATTSPVAATGQEANGMVAKAVAAVVKATGSTPAVAKAV